MLSGTSQSSETFLGKEHFQSGPIMVHQPPYTFIPNDERGVPFQIWQT